MTASDLRCSARRIKNGRVVRRLLAIALVLEGADRASAARSCGMDRQTLRDWVHRYNAEGIAGLYDRGGRGAKARLSTKQQAQLVAWVESGPDPKKDGVVRWRCVDLQARVKEDLGVTLHERTIGKYLAKHGFRRLSVRPEHPKTDRTTQEAFKKNFATLIADTLPEKAKGKPLEIWFQDEARVGQQGTLTRKWARRGTRPRAPCDTRYTWSYIFGAACPSRGVAAGLILPYINTEAMGLHLNEISKAIAPGGYALLIVDGASWHGAKDLNVPDNMSLIKLPPYSPELNPMENVWAYLRANKLAITVFDSYEEILDKCSQAWNFFANDPDRITSITNREWIKVN